MKTLTLTLRAAGLAAALALCFGCGSRTPLGNGNDGNRDGAPTLASDQAPPDTVSPDVGCTSCDSGDLPFPHPTPVQPCNSNADCAPARFCMLDGQCVVSGAKAGICQARPTTCPDYYVCPSVCGCDGQTYCSECEAHAAGVSVATPSACLASTCAALEAEYVLETSKAKVCCPFCAALQCETVAPPLGCGCETKVNLVTPKMKALRQQWTALGCHLTQPPCGIRCAAPKPATCLPTSAPAGPTSGICTE